MKGLSSEDEWCMLDTVPSMMIHCFLFRKLKFPHYFYLINAIECFDLFSHNNEHSIHFTRHLFRIMDGFLELDAVDVVTCWYISTLSLTMAQCTEKVISITLYKLFDCSWVKSIKWVVVGLR